MTAANEVPDKRQTVTEFAAKGETVLILDARQPGVRVPFNLRDQRELRLKFSHRYDTGALVFTDEGVRQSLKFGDEVFACFVPWSALVAAIQVAEKIGCAWDKPADPAPRKPRHLYAVN